MKPGNVQSLFKNVLKAGVSSLVMSAQRKIQLAAGSTAVRSNAMRHITAKNLLRGAIGMSET
jgi:hypothetical protein